jgi:hypothetical protein
MPVTRNALTPEANAVDRCSCLMCSTRRGRVDTATDEYPLTPSSPQQRCPDQRQFYGKAVLRTGDCLGRNHRAEAHFRIPVRRRDRRQLPQSAHSEPFARPTTSARGQLHGQVGAERPAQARLRFPGLRAHLQTDGNPDCCGATWPEFRPTSGRWGILPSLRGLRYSRELPSAGCARCKRRNEWSHTQRGARAAKPRTN